MPFGSSGIRERRNVVAPSAVFTRFCCVAMRSRSQKPEAVWTDSNETWKENRSAATGGTRLEGHRAIEPGSHFSSNRAPIEVNIVQQRPPLDTIQH